MITHWHLDHWGDLVPWVWGNMVGPGQGTEQPELWLPPRGARRSRDFGTRLGWEDMFESTFDVRDYAEAVPFKTAAGLEVVAIRLPHYTLRTYGFRVSNGDTTLAYSGDSGPERRARRRRARRRPLRLRGDARCAASSTASPRGHLSVDEAVEAFEASGAKRLLLTHRPNELPAPDGWELAYDGLQISL